MMLLAKAAEVLDGYLVFPDAVEHVQGMSISAVSSDSRKLSSGDLFVALRGEHFDGYEFIAQAAQSGAIAALVNKDSVELDVARNQGAETVHAITLLVVEDTRLALGRLAAYWRQQFAIPLIAITGSNGKTTVKEMLASILRVAAGNDAAVLATQGNLNNDIGVPLTLLGMNAQHRYAVIEMGMNHPGEIDYLTHLACPDVALINNASGAHLQGLGSVEAVARAKSEIFSGLKAQGMAVINSDDEYAPLWRSLIGTCALLEFGLDEQADVSGRYQAHGTGLELFVQAPSGHFSAMLQVPGEHNARNALAASAAAIALNVPLAVIASGLQNFSGVPGRLQRKQASCGATLIDDSYNANPASLLAAISVLAQAAGKRVLVLGDMGELGNDAVRLHAEIGKAARQSGIDGLYAVGELSRHAVHEFGRGAQHFESLEALLAVLAEQLDAQTTVLVKGSRFMKMERVVKYLERHAHDAHSSALH